MTTTTATQSHTTAASRHVPEGSEVRGFGLYVGVDEALLAQDGTDLGQIVTALKERLAELAPSAESYATVALAPAGLGGRNIDIARFALAEPAARARRHQQEDAANDRAASGVTVDLTRKRVLLDNIATPLTFREFELLQFFVLREGQNISREDIIETLWSDADGEEIPNARTIDVHIRRLRVKLAQYQDIIRTVRGVGYRFDRHADVRIVQGATRSPDHF
ncbi:MAG: winged helix-turn-helix domain-containing protein [Canibacter sp.]